jgi:cellobiose-specific phosphotransferase system component IIB
MRIQSAFGLITVQTHTHTHTHKGIRSADKRVEFIDRMAYVMLRGLAVLKYLEMAVTNQISFMNKLRAD